jgi:hypothetical protein
MLEWLIDVFALLCTSASASCCTTAYHHTPLVLCWLSSPLVCLSSCHRLLPRPTHPLAGCCHYASHPDAVSCCASCCAPLVLWLVVASHPATCPLLAATVASFYSSCPSCSLLAVVSCPPLVVTPAPCRCQWQYCPCLCVALLPARAGPSSRHIITARHIHRGNIKVPTVSILCYTYLQDAWQTDGQRHTTTQSPCVTEM